MKRTICVLATGLLLMLAPASSAKVIGRMTPAEPLTMQRIALLPPGQQQAWKAYLERSKARRAADKAALAAELAILAKSYPSPPEGSVKSMPLDKPAAWYGTAEARRIADNIVSYQTPTGGWGKNQDRTAPLRERGRRFAIVENLPPEAAQDIITDDTRWAYVGTLDNGATTTELRFLAKVQSAIPLAEGEAYRASFVKGIRYLLEAQYPNGGWPQIYPLQGGYHDAITFNDDAMAHAIEVLMDAGARKAEFAFVPASLAAQARSAADRGVAVVLASQVVLGGRRTGWGQQHDALTLKPVGARNFEPMSLSSNETAAVLRLLMRLPNPSDAVVRSVHDGIAWLQSVALRDVEWKIPPGGEGKLLLPAPGAGPLWSRMYDLQTMKPIFGDRDKTIHDDVSLIMASRRNGYSWYGSGPANVIAAYRKWALAHPARSAARKTQ